MERYASEYRDKYGKDDILPLIGRFIKHSESFGLTVGQILKGIYQLCGEDPGHPD